MDNDKKTATVNRIVSFSMPQDEVKIFLGYIGEHTNKSSWIRSAIRKAMQTEQEQQN